MDAQETARALFGRKPEPEAPTPAADQPITGPVIPGQESTPAHVNKTATSTFIDNLFNN